MSGRYNKRNGKETVNSILRVRLDGTDYLRDLVCDSRQRGLVITGDDVYMLNEGYGYTCTDVQNVDTTTQKWLLQTPSPGKGKVHMIFDFEGTGEVLIKFYEETDRDGSTSLSSYNSNRNSSGASNTNIYRGTTGGSTDGTLLFSKRSGSTGQAARTVSIGSDRGYNVWILKPSTKYIFSVQTFGNIHVTFHLDWFEFSDRN